MSDTPVSRWIERAQKVTLRDQVIQFASALYWHEWQGKPQVVPRNVPSHRPPSNMHRGTITVRMYRALHVSILTASGRVQMHVEYDQYLGALATLSEVQQQHVQRFLLRRPERESLGFNGVVEKLPPSLDRSRYADQVDGLTALYRALGGPT